MRLPEPTSDLPFIVITFLYMPCSWHLPRLLPSRVLRTLA